ncbi:phenylacetate--CoA ligase family protein [Bizionia saleffrena]|uniref:Phenylacetate--CoA ligase family protein n=1 Tax=Bizionia saleffrena TaxID=291189 RepID=A0A8H2LCL4_9FLAO|nr:phenylacetate--CoA ligase family protein [Bizionia saleffrena]TYB74209.1 phenylacetate--CoA ligase family protein [Bizionia saleffrena]
MNLFNLSLRFKGFPMTKACSDFEAISAISSAEYPLYIEKQRQKIVTYHLKHNSFYRGLTEGINTTDWNSLPILTKKEVQQPLQQRLSEGFTLRNCHIHKTSGSSGTPFIFAKDNYCHALTWAGFIKRYNVFNIDLNHSKQARFYGIPLDTQGYYKERLKDALSNRYRFSVFDLSDATFKNNVKTFSNTPFDYINGYTSAIVQFAKYLKREQIILQSVCPTLKACIVTSEMLFEDDKHLLEQYLGVPIINEYGAAELGLIAFQDANDHWRVNSADLYVEIIDDDNKVLPYGEIGRVVVTSLYNKAHPFIRYDLGDLGRLSKSSTTKTPLLETLIGRTSDIARLPSGKTAAGLTFYYITKTIIEDGSIVKEFIIEQLELNTFKISYVSTNSLSEDKKREIQHAFDIYLEPGLHLVYKQKQVLHRSKSGKLKQFVSYL